MSTEEPEEEAPAAPPVRLIEIDLRELLEFPRLSPLERLAAVAALARLLDELWLRAPRNAEKVLLGAWEAIERRLAGVLVAGIGIQQTLLHEYFVHYGDWRAIRHCCLENGERHQSARGEFAQLIEQHYVQARKEYVALYGEIPA